MPFADVKRSLAIRWQDPSNPRQMMQAEFGRRLDALVHERFRSAARFVDAVHEAGGEISPSQLSRVLRGLWPPPVDQLPLWAKVLALRGRDAEAFRIAGELAQLPDGSMVVKRIRANEALVAELTREVERAQAEAATLRRAITTRAPTDQPDRT